jgi:hypothetical protein
MEPQFQQSLGAQQYHWLQAQLAAAERGYEQADRELQDMAPATVSLPELGNQQIPMPETASLIVGQVILEGSSQLGGTTPLAYTILQQTSRLRQFFGLAGSLRLRAEVTVLRGLLALESGEINAARTCFRQALAVWRSEAAASSGAGLDFSARAVAQRSLELVSD